MKTIIAILIPFVVLSCSSNIININDSLPIQHIKVGAGPEDIQLVSKENKSYLLVSCLERRIPNKDGNMWLVDLQNYKKSFVLPRKGEPQGLRLRPHGFYVHDNKHVYIVHHGLDQYGNIGTGLEGDTILYYIWDGTSLVFQKIYSNELLINPNDITVLPDGSFYVTNGYSNNLFTFLLQDWNLKARSIITHYDNTQKKWSVAASCLPFANGIHYLHEKDVVLISMSSGKNLWMYNREKNGSLTHPRLVASDIGLADNITQADGQNMILTSHQSKWNFYCHTKSKDSPAPTMVWKINIATKEADILYANQGGNRINAGSTAVLYKDKLYIAQVFEPYLEVVHLGTE